MKCTNRDYQKTIVIIINKKNKREQESDTNTQTHATGKQVTKKKTKKNEGPVTGWLTLDHSAAF